MKFTLLFGAILTIWRTVKGDEHDHKVSIYSKEAMYNYISLESLKPF